MSVTFARVASISVLAAISAACAACGGGDPSADAASDIDTDSHDIDANGSSDPSERHEVAEFLAASVPGSPQATDRDGDGIDDVTEELLLRRYRPWLKFSKDGDGNDEAHRPADPVAIMRNAQLRQFKGDGDGTTDPLNGCGRAGDHHLDPASQIFTCRKDTSFLTNFAKTSYALNIADADYAGVSFDTFKKDATGFFGHVVGDTVNGHPAYKLEYWGYYGFNNQDIGVPGYRVFGDHEGDWTGVQVWFDRTEQRVAQILYLIHGRRVSFTLTPAMGKTTGASCFVSVKGPKYNPNPGNLFDDNERAQYDDNQAELWIDASGFKHVVVYVENGGHESWPGAWGHADIDAGPFTLAHPNPHHGDGTSLLLPVPAGRPLNIGEVEKPLTKDGAIILQYNGYWGSTNANDFGIRVRKSPPGPASHCEWKFPNRGALAHCEN